MPVISIFMLRFKPVTDSLIRILLQDGISGRNWYFQPRIVPSGDFLASLIHQM